MASKSSAAAASLSVTPKVFTAQAITYPVTAESIASTFAKYSAISFATPEGYEEGRKALAHLRQTRGAVKERHKELKADSLEYGRQVDSAKNLFIRLLEEIENPLQAKKDAADAERARLRRAKEDAEREALRVQEEAKLAEQRAQLEAERQAIADAQARLAEEQRIAREQAEAQRAEERQALEAAKLELEQEKVRIAEERRVAAAEAEQLATERQAVEAEREVVAQAGAELARVQEEVTAKVAAFEEAASAPPVAVGASTPAPEATQILAPDRSDWVSAPSLAGEAAAMHEFARQIRALKSPSVTTDTAAAIIEQVEFMLSEAAQALESFETQEAASAAE